ncbi:hypothetical protein ACLOJK_041721 [Asimina triloba]
MNNKKEGDKTFMASLNEEVTLIENGTLSSGSEMVYENTLFRVMQDVLEDVESLPQCPVRVDPQRRRYIDQAIESTDIA